MPVGTRAGRKRIQEEQPPDAQDPDDGGAVPDFTADLGNNVDGDEAALDTDTTEQHGDAALDTDTNEQHGDIDDNNNDDDDNSEAIDRLRYTC